MNRTWRRTLGQNIRKLTAEQARDILAAHSLHGPQIGDPAIRQLTGGYSCQSIDFIVILKLAVKAGMIKKGV